MYSFSTPSHPIPNTLQRERILNMLNLAYTKHVIEKKRLGFKRVMSPTTGDTITTVCSYTRGCAIGVNLSPKEIKAIRKLDDQQCGAEALMDKVSIDTYKSGDTEILNDLQICHDEATRYHKVRSYDENYGSGKITGLNNVQYPNEPMWKIVKHNYEVFAEAYGLEILS